MEMGKSWTSFSRVLGLSGCRFRLVLKSETSSVPTGTFYDWYNCNTTPCIAIRSTLALTINYEKPDIFMAKV